MTDINDIVLIYLEEKPFSFARLEAIEPDVKRGWYHVQLLLLQVPLQVVTWILRDVYINGETFTMDGKPLRLERVVRPNQPERNPSPAPDASSMAPAGTAARKGPTTEGKVISLADLKKKP